MAASPEDVRLAENLIRNKNDYYKVLGVGRDATPDEIKRSYRRLCLKLHPDKNPHPKAAEAFKILSTANAVLSDEGKRRTYDRHGEEGVQRQEQGHNPAAPTFRRGGGGQLDAEDFFNAFFFGAAPRQRHPHQHHHQQQQYNQGGHRRQAHAEFDINPAFLLPVFLFFIMMLFMSSRLVDSSDNGGQSSSHRGSNVVPNFSLHLDKKEGLTHKRTTNMREFPSLNVDYYVAANFNALYNRGLVDVRKLELQVLGKQKHYLERRCRAETLKKQNSIRGADLSVCDEYNRYRYVPS